MLIRSTANCSGAGTSHVTHSQQDPCRSGIRGMTMNILCCASISRRTLHPCTGPCCRGACHQSGYGQSRRQRPLIPGCGCAVCGRTLRYARTRAAAPAHRKVAASGTGDLANRADIDSVRRGALWCAPQPIIARATADLDLVAERGCSTKPPSRSARHCSHAKSDWLELLVTPRSS